MIMSMTLGILFLFFRPAMTRKSKTLIFLLLVLVALYEIARILYHTTMRLT